MLTQVQTPASSPMPLLEARGLVKQFGDLRANDNVNIAIYPGEVHAILGENGAGKSTLMKMLYGFYQPTSGQIFLNGQPTTINSPQDGRRLGIGMVFQNFTLIPALTVIENVALFLPDLRAVFSQKEIEQRIKEASAKYDLHVDPRAIVGELSMGEQQKVEILKIILAGARVLIFDEPTSVLAPHEVGGLFQVFNKLRADGYAILFITHKMPEVMAVADRITVLRRGRIVETMPVAGATETELVTMLLGAAPPEAARITQTRDTTGQTPLLIFDRITVPDEQTKVGLKEVTFQVFPGEIVGVAGVSGNGQQTLIEAALGLRPHTAGTIHLMGENVANWPVEKKLQAGLGCIPEDPLLMGAVPGMRVYENMILGEQHKYADQGGLSMNWKRVRDKATQFLNSTFISSAPRLEVMVETLSGGNLQRVIIAREVGRQPKLLIAYYVARGLDISNAEAARRLLLKHREQGMGILLISEDLDELFALSDRLLVMHHGHIVGTFRPQETTAHDVGILMTGGTITHA
ncbi:MAG: ABC transporter ATP-binding protein [Anaerolineae bacterium]